MSANLLNTLQADVAAVLAATPALADAVIHLNNEGDIEARVIQSLAPIKGATSGKRGLCLVVLPPEVTQAEANLPGPPLLVKIEIQAIENFIANRDATAGTGIYSDAACLLALAALHHQVLGGHALYAEDNPVAPARVKPGYGSHILTVFARANGVQGPGKPAAVTFSESVQGTSIVLSGTLSQPISGTLIQSPRLTGQGTVAGGWTSTGTQTPAPSGPWARLYAAWLITPESATLEAIAPAANYLATTSQSTASRVTVQTWPFGALKLYWLYDAGGGSRRWVDAADAGLADQGATVIPAGRLINPQTRMATTVFIGGLGAAWQSSGTASWQWVLLPFNNGSSSGLGYWSGAGTSPAAAAWSAVSPATGVPAFTNANPWGMLTVAGNSLTDGQDPPNAITVPPLIFAGFYNGRPSWTSNGLPIEDASSKWTCFWDSVSLKWGIGDPDAVWAVYDATDAPHPAGLAFPEKYIEAQGGTITAVSISSVPQSDIALACATPGSQIRYTTDGSYPAPAAATLYAAPFASPAVGTVIRAAAYKSGLNPGDVTEILITD